MRILAAFIISLLFFLGNSYPVEAIRLNPNCGNSGDNSLVKEIDYPTQVKSNEVVKVFVQFNTNLVDQKDTYILLLSDDSFGGATQSKSNFVENATSPTGYNFTLDNPGKAGVYKLKLRRNPLAGFTGSEVCDLGTITISNATLAQTTCKLTMPNKIKAGDTVPIVVAASLPVKTYVPHISDGMGYGLVIYDQNDYKQLSSNPTSTPPDIDKSQIKGTYAWDDGFLSEIPQTVSYTTTRPGSYIAGVYARHQRSTGVVTSEVNYFFCASLPFQVGNDLTTNSPVTSQPVTPPGTNPAPGSIIHNCTAGDPNCIRGGGKFCENGGVETAIGCIPTQPADFINGIMKFTAGAAGGIALLLMVTGSFQMITSQGNPDQLKQGRDQFVAAVSGLLFIIFSVTLLRIIGVDILQIPGFQ